MILAECGERYRKGIFLFAGVLPALLQRGFSARFLDPDVIRFLHSFESRTDRRVV